MSIFEHFLQSLEETFSHSVTENKQFCVLVIFAKTPKFTGLGSWAMTSLLGNEEE